MRYLILFVFLLLPTAADAVWFDSSWDYRVKVEVVPSKVGSSTAVTAFPVYNDCGGFPGSFWTNAQADGDDIRVVESGETTETPFELVSFSTTSNRCELHFLADTMGTTSTSTFYVYYGNPAASAYAVTDPYGRNAVWADYEFVSHNGATDSTGIYTPTANGGITTGGATGIMGSATTFDGANDYYTLGDPAGLQLTTVTNQVWLKTSTSQASYRGLFVRHRQIGAILTLGNEILSYDWTANGNILTGQFANTGAWRLIHSQAQSGGASTAKVYVDGTLRVTNTVTNAAADSWYLGQISSSAGQNFAGDLDEFRIRNSLLSPAWIITEWNNQNATTTFFAIGVEESDAPAPEVEATTTPASIYRDGVFGGGTIFQ